MLAMVRGSARSTARSAAAACARRARAPAAATRGVSTDASAGGRTGAPGHVGTPPPPPPPPHKPASTPPHFPGFAAAPGHPSQWTPREQWAGLGVLAAGLTGGLWWWASRAPPPEGGEKGASWERGPA
jgi:hypothetical protein